MPDAFTKKALRARIHSAAAAQHGRDVVIEKVREV